MVYAANIDGCQPARFCWPLHAVKGRSITERKQKIRPRGSDSNEYYEETLYKL